MKPPKSPMVDIPSGGARSIKNMWEKGNVTNPIDPPKKVRPTGGGGWRGMVG